jgi:hypothetical protein
LHESLLLHHLLLLHLLLILLLLLLLHLPFLPLALWSSDQADPMLAEPPVTAPSATDEVQVAV